MPSRKIVVVGGGLVGLGTARALLCRHPGTRVSVLEKEARAGTHQSTHNSGVLHAGLYYKPGSFKAKLAVRGIRRMTSFCQEWGIAHEICGKLVVATRESEIPRLRALLERGTANGLHGLQWLTAEQAREIEPFVSCLAAVRVPEEGIVDYGAVVRALVGEIEARGGAVVTGARVTSIHRRPSGWLINTTAGEHEADFLINCAGLYSDRVASMAGERPPCRIIPFRGEYHRLRPGREDLVRHLIYPVPDPAFPFLGVHFTRLIGGGVEAGPNAVLAFAREGYRTMTVNVRELVDSLGYPGLWRFLARHAGASYHELRMSLSQRVFAAALQRMVPALQELDLVPGGAGVRAQAMNADGSLVDDFLFLRRANALHVLNAPSPGATASLVIGEEIAAQAS